MGAKGGVKGKKRGGAKEEMWGAGMSPRVVAYCHDPCHPSQVGVGSMGSTSERTSMRGDVVFSGGRQPGMGGDKVGREGAGAARGRKGGGGRARERARLR